MRLTSKIAALALLLLATPALAVEAPKPEGTPPDAALLAEGSAPYPVIELIRRHHLDCPAQFVAAPGRQCRVHRSQAGE